MTTRALLLATALVGPACAHSRVATDEPQRETPAAKDVASSGSPESSKDSSKRGAKEGGKEEAAASPADRTRSPTGLPLSTSPAASLADGAAAKLQERLAAEGHLAPNVASERLDAATERALREFQSAHNLPATGVPDDATVRALGLDPEKIFRRAPPDR